MENPLTRRPHRATSSERRTENQHEVSLMQENPGALVTLYQEMIGHIVIHFVSSGLFHPSEIDEVVQSVNLDLLLKMPVIRRQYNGTTLLKTYISTIVRNTCLRLKQKQRLSPLSTVLDEEAVADPERVDNRLILKDAIEQFRLILKMFDRQLPKLLLALKIYYQIPMHRDELVSWYPRSDSTVLNALVTLFTRTTDRLTPNRVYQQVAPIINALEGKDNTPDAFRKWSSDKIDEIIDLLNGSSKSRNFDRDSLRELVEDFFSPFLLEK
jgi:DNA-directed RNA polymerase specialized sigma24 family protein